jgi:hypothetical protein
VEEGGEGAGAEGAASGDGVGRQSLRGPGARGQRGSRCAGAAQRAAEEECPGCTRHRNRSWVVGWAKHGSYHNGLNEQGNMALLVRDGPASRRPWLHSHMCFQEQSMAPRRRESAVNAAETAREEPRRPAPVQYKM